MDDSMKDPMRSEGLSHFRNDPDPGEEHGKAAPGDKAMPSRAALTHRGRPFAELTSSAIKTATGKTATGAGQARSALQSDTTDNSQTSIPDLRPLADQLIAIAQQLRDGRSLAPALPMRNGENARRSLAILNCLESPPGTSCSISISHKSRASLYPFPARASAPPPRPPPAGAG